jgi:hypothetical protein
MRCTNVVHDQSGARSMNMVHDVLVRGVLQCLASTP